MIQYLFFYIIFFYRTAIFLFKNLCPYEVIFIFTGWLKGSFSITLNNIVAESQVQVYCCP